MDDIKWLIKEGPDRTDRMISNINVHPLTRQSFEMCTHTLARCCERITTNNNFSGDWPTKKDPYYATSQSEAVLEIPC